MLTNLALSTAWYCADFNSVWDFGKTQAIRMKTKVH